MSWDDDVPAARAGDPSARARLEELLAAFAHAALLVRQPRERAARSVFDVLDELWSSLPPPEQSLVKATLERARLSGGASLPEGRPGGVARDDEPDATRSAVLEDLRPVSPELKELLLLRLAYGYPFPQLAALVGESLPTLRRRFDAEGALVLERLGVPASDLEYLWSGEGRGSLGIARVETQLTKLRSELQPFARDRLRAATLRARARQGGGDDEAPTELETRQALAERAVPRSRLAPTRSEFRGEDATVLRDRPPPARPGAVRGAASGGADASGLPARGDRPPVAAPGGGPPSQLATRDSRVLGPWASTDSEPPAEDDTATRGRPGRRDSRGRRAALFLGLALGVAAAWAILALRAPPPKAPVAAVVLATDVEAFETLEAADLTTVALAEERVAAQVLLAADAGSLVGRVLPVAWTRGEPLPKAVLEAAPMPRWETLTLAAPRSLQASEGELLDLLVPRGPRPRGEARGPERVAIARALRVVDGQEGARRRTGSSRVTLLIPWGGRGRLESALRGVRWELARSAGPAALEPEAEVVLQRALLRDRLAQGAKMVARIRVEGATGP